MLSVLNESILIYNTKARSNGILKKKEIPWLCLKNSLILLKVFKKLFFVNFPIVFKTPTRFLLE
ncbi:hypothetical protein EC508_04675 [Helicobacter pylori]|nr:hypothetical protein EC508_04675 [Helicobacter pylori]